MATYEEIKKYVAEHNEGMKVSNLYIAQVKNAIKNGCVRKCGIELVENFNLSQVIAKLAKLIRNPEPKQGRIRAEHEFQNEKWITGHFRRTLISYRLYEGGKS